MTPELIATFWLTLILGLILGAGFLACDQPPPPAVCPSCHGTRVLWAHVGEFQLSYLPPDYPTNRLLFIEECGYAHWFPVQCPCQGVQTFSPPYGSKETPR